MDVYPEPDKAGARRGILKSGVEKERVNVVSAIGDRGACLEHMRSGLWRREAGHGCGGARHGPHIRRQAGAAPVGGQRPRNNSFTIEGVDNNRRDVTGHNVAVPNEAVAEFTVLQNQFSAEFGGGTGGQFITSIRGGSIRS